MHLIQVPQKAVSHGAELMNFGKKLTTASLLLLVAAMLALPAHTAKSSGRLQTPGESDSSVAQKVCVRVSDFQLFASARTEKPLI